MPTELAEHCIYTIVHPDRLTAAARRRRAATFHQLRRWVTGLRLWRQAQKMLVGMPVLLGDATDCSQLLHWALLTNVAVTDAGTSFTVDRVRRLTEDYAPQDLVLRSSGEHIAPNFIRPYAICCTPDFLTA
jgi:hypothetical protein